MHSLSVVEIKSIGGESSCVSFILLMCLIFYIIILFQIADQLFTLSGSPIASDPIKQGDFL